MDRFARTRLLLGKEKLERLHQAKVTVIGLGAVGSQAVEAMARAGVGSFRLVDFDIIRPSNINRHIWATELTLGRPKSIVAKERLHSINPHIKVEALEVFAAKETFADIFDNDPDIILDAIDSLNPKVQTLAFCHQNKLPIISSMGAATRTDISKLRVADIFETKCCPLAAHVRRRLKELKIGKGIQCVYSEQPRNMSSVAPEAVKDAGECERGRPRRAMGSIATITGMFGLMLAHLAIEKICGGWQKSNS